MSVEGKLQAIIAAANTATGETDTTLTDAVQTLIDGFGQGGGVLPAEIESITVYTQEEAWTTDVLGNALNFANFYCNYADTTDRKLYVCFITNNTAHQNYRADYFVVQRYSEYGSMSCNMRNNYTNASTSVVDSRSFYISQGAKVKVFVFKYGGTE